MDYINDVEAIVLYDKLLKEYYRILSMPTEEIRNIYKVMNLPDGKQVTETYYEDYKYERRTEEEFEYEENF